MAESVQGHREAQTCSLQNRPEKWSLPALSYWGVRWAESEMSLSLGPVLPSLESPAHLWLLEYT